MNISSCLIYAVTSRDQRMHLRFYATVNKKFSSVSFKRWLIRKQIQSLILVFSMCIPLSEHISIIPLRLPFVLNYQGKWRKIKYILHTSLPQIIPHYWCVIQSIQMWGTISISTPCCILVFYQFYYFVNLILLSSVFSFPSSIGEMPDSHISVVSFLWMEKGLGESQGEREGDGI